MVELLDQEPVSTVEARVWAESLTHDSRYEDALAIADALAATPCERYQGHWPISARNARLLRDALLVAAQRARH